MISFKLRKIEFENFNIHQKPFKYDVSAYEKGLHLISGRNGSGKTSILEALCLGLTNSALSGRKKEKLVNRSREDFLIKIEFELDSTVYELNQTLKTKKLFVLENGQKRLKSHNAAQINHFLKQLVDSKMVFLNQCLICPNTARASYLPWLSPSQQFEFFKNLFELDSYQKISDLAKDEVQKLEIEKVRHEERLRLLIEERQKMLEKEESEIDFEINLLEKKHQNLKDEIKRIKQSLNEIEKEKENEKLTLEKIENSLKEIEKELIEKKKDFSNLNEKYRSRLSEIEKDFDQNLELLETKISEKENESRSLRERRQKEIEKLLDLKRNQELSFEKKISRLEISKSQLIEQIKNLKEKRDSFIKQKKEELFQLKEQEKKLLKSIEDKICRFCGSKIRDSQRIEKEISSIREKLKETLDQLEKDKKRLSEDIEKNEFFLKSIEKKIQSLLKEKETSLKEIESEIEKISSSYDSTLERIDQKLQALRDEKKFLRKRKELIKKQDQTLVEIENEITKVESEIEELENRYRDLTSQRLLILKNSKTLAYEKTLTLISEKENQLQEIRKKISDLIEKKKELKSRIEKSILEQSNQIENRLSEIEKELRTYDYIRKIFRKDLLSFFISLKLKEIEDISNAISASMDLDMVFDFDFDLEKKVFSLNAYFESTLAEIDDFSRGEFTLYSLILSLAISIFLSRVRETNFNFIFFDEVLDSLDQENTEAVLEQLRRFSRERNQNVFLVSPDEKIRNYSVFDSIMVLD